MVAFINILMSLSVPIVIIALLGFIAFSLFKLRKNSITKPISREEIERKRFIERMKINVNQYPFKLLYRGKDCIGKIIYSKGSTLQGNPHNHIIIEMVVQPKLFWIFTNPLAKQQAIQIHYGSYNEKNQLEKLVVEDGDKIILPKWISFDYYFGIYYDNSLAKEHHEVIKNTDLFLTDLNDLASIYFVKSQESAIFDPNRAERMALKERDLEVELAKKKGEQQSI